MEDTSYRLIVAYFEKTISDDGLTQLKEWIEESPENLEKFSETIQILGASKSYFKQTDQSEKSWAKINAHIHQNGAVAPSDLSDHETLVKKTNYKWLAYAASLLIISGIAALWFKRTFNKAPLAIEYAQISNIDGQHKKILLPDSSVVYLGGGSKLRYAKNFLGAKRTVYLDGEAFFDVVHQSKRPFVVKSGEITTVVLGTSFNVKAFAKQNKVAVTVQTGKVGVMASVHGKSQLVKYLVPDEQIEINTLTGLYTFNTTEAVAVSAWINNDFIFSNTPLRDIAASLEHHYGVKIEFTDPDQGNSRLTAKFKNMPLKKVMDNLMLLSGLGYTQKGNHLFISDTNQRGGKIMK